MNFPRHLWRTRHKRYWGCCGHQSQSYAVIIIVLLVTGAVLVAHKGASKFDKLQMGNFSNYNKKRRDMNISDFIFSLDSFYVDNTVRPFQKNTWTRLWGIRFCLFNRNCLAIWFPALIFVGKLSQMKHLGPRAVFPWWCGVVWLSRPSQLDLEYARRGDGGSWENREVLECTVPSFLM